MTHRHFVDSARTRKPCVEIDPTICLTRTSDGYFLHFDPPAHDGAPRRMGGVSIKPGAWTETGTLDAGDLTITPSIAISTNVDGATIELLHGWVRDGKWVPA